jgi:hypothetical protein
MKKSKLSNLFPVSLGIGIAASVALKDNAVGFGIGLAIFIMLNFSARFQKRKTQ